MIVDPDIEEATGTSPDLAVSPPGQADVVYRVVETAGPAQRAAAAARRRGRERARRALRRPALVEPGRDQPRPGCLDAPADAGQRAADRDRPDQQRRGRLAGARHRRRGAHLGQAAVRQHARLRAAGQRGELRRRADLRRRRRAERGRLAAGPGRGRLPAGRGSRLAAAGSAHLPEHPARRRIEQRRGVRRRRHCRRRRGRGQVGLRSGRRASTSTNSRTCACCTTQTARRA